MDRIGADGVLAALVVLWFIIIGVSDLVARQPGGRRAVAASGGVRIARRVRGALEVLGGLAVAAGAAVTVLGLRVPFPARLVGLGLAALALWGVVETARPPARWLRLVAYAVGFVLAVFYAGFRA